MDYITVFTRDDGQCDCMAADEQHLDAAVTRWAIEKRDELLSLTTLDGAMYKVLASEITSWIESTPATRARGRELRAEMQAEEPTRHPWEKDND